MNSRTVKWLWPILLLSGAPAWIVGAWLYLRHQPDPQLGIAISRDEAIDKAVHEAAVRGIESGEWSSYVDYEPQHKLVNFRSAANSGYPVPMAIISVKLLSANKEQSFEVKFDQKGELLGYLILEKNPRELEGIQAANESVIRAGDVLVAREAIKKRVGLDIAQDAIEIIDPVRGEPGIRTYRWRWPVNEFSDLIIYSEAKVRDNRLVGEMVRAVAAPAGRSDNNLNGSRFVGQSIKVLYYLLLALSVLAGSIRFLQLSREGEVSITRSITLALVVSGIMCLPIWLSDQAVYHYVTRPILPIPTYLIQLQGSLFYLLIGGFLGMAYGGGEGSLREAYPGKLSSLDALFSGHLLTRHLSRNLLVGVALGGWSYLLITIRPLLGLGNQGLADHSAWFGRVPYLSIISYRLPEVLLIIITGLLIPLPILYRGLGSHKRVLPCLLLTLWTGSLVTEDNFNGTQFIYPTTIRAIITLIAFLKFDLLAAIVALATPFLTGEILSQLWQPAAAIHQAGMVSACALLIFILIIIILSIRGNPLRGDQFSPRYAHNLRERLSMQAEVRAASEAQLRLLPANIPKQAGFIIAARCRPAREVGGDFYDICRLDENRVAVIIADGRGSGLGSALSMAFAIGYLRPLLSDCTVTEGSPAAILKSLLNQFAVQSGQHREDESITPFRMGILLAIADRIEGAVHFARTGQIPAIRTVGNDGKISLVDTNNSLDTVASGVFPLHAGELIIFSSEGIERQLHASGHMLRSLLNKDQVQDLPGFVDGLIEQFSALSRELNVESDLTLVVLRIGET